MFTALSRKLDIPYSKYDFSCVYEIEWSLGFKLCVCVCFLSLKARMWIVKMVQLLQMHNIFDRKFYVVGNLLRSFFECPYSFFIG